MWPSVSQTVWISLVKPPSWLSQIARIYFPRCPCVYGMGFEGFGRNRTSCARARCTHRLAPVINDGKRFLRAVPLASNSAAPFTVVVNWTAK